MRKFKQLTTAVFAFALTLLAAIMITGTPVQAASQEYTFDAGTGTLTITGNEGFNQYRQENNMVDQMETVVDTQVKAVVITQGVTEITQEACKNFTVLTSVSIPNSVNSIKNAIFQGCNKLTAVTFPEGITSIPEYAFAECSDLTQVTIPSTVASIGINAFSRCKKLTSITLPHSIVSIGENAFYASGIQEIIIPNGVTSIEKRAFEDCKSLTTVKLPENLTEIDEEAFYGCDSLTSITIPAGVTSIKEGAFNKAAKLLEITMKSATPAAIGADIFKGISPDFKIYVPLAPKGTVDIYKAAPGWVEYKEHIVVEPHDHVAGDWIIDTPATEIAEGTKHTECTLCGEVLQTVVLPKIVTPEPPKTIASFKSGIYTYTTTGEKTVKVTGFVKGKSTSKVTIPKSVTYQEKTYQVTEIADKAFYKNTKIKTINIGNNVTKIGKNAFKQCTKLTDAVIGNKVKEIGTSAFYKCTSLKKVTVGTGLKKIGSHVFCHDKKLGELVIKSTKLTTIGKHNLYNCKNLKIKVPSSKVKAYTKLIKGQGQKAKANVKVTK